MMHGVSRIPMTAGQILVLSVLTLGVIGSALAVVHAKYQSRLLFVDLQKVRQERDRLDMDWGRLQLELGTWGGHSRIENLARNRLKMRLPKADEIVVVRR